MLPYHIFSFFHVLHCLRIHSFFEYNKSLCEMSVQLVLLIAILKLLSPRRLFTYFRLRYTQNQIHLLNAVLRKRFYCRNVAYNVSFLTRCLNTGVCPCGVQKRVPKTKDYHSSSIEREYFSKMLPYHIFSFFHVLHCLRIHSFFEYNKSLCEMSVQLVLLIAILKLFFFY